MIRIGPTCVFAPKELIYCITNRNAKLKMVKMKYPMLHTVLSSIPEYIGTAFRNMSTPSEMTRLIMVIQTKHEIVFPKVIRDLIR